MPVDCLSPDVLAAWMDGTLSVDERANAEAHAADCAHCQAMLAAMARTAPPVPQRAWWKSAGVRWLAPVTAAVTVIAIVVGVQRAGEPERSTLAVDSVSSPARPAAEALPDARPPVSAEVPPPAEQRRDAAKSPASERDPAARGAASKPDAFTGSADRLDAPTRKEALEPPVAKAPAAASAVAGMPAGGVASAPAPAPPPPAQSAAAATPAPPPPAVSALPLQEAVTITAEDSLKSVEQRDRNAALRSAASPPVEVVSPERKYRWRALEPGNVQYSMDAGMSWRPSSTGTAVRLRAGSAPSPQVCWFVGQLGTVLLTTDGRTFTIRPFPERVDLTDVRATDARSAVVTTANRRRFATTDGGATWSPLQEN